MKFDKMSPKKSENTSQSRMGHGPKVSKQSAIELIINKYDEFDSKSAKTFKDFPISQETLNGLINAGFLEPTDIQREAIGLALRGFDILGAAMTGSGKTLAFLIPILELLWRNRWTRFDGLGILIISPTRELAMQTFEVLRKVGAEHDFSAALIVGGTNVKYEERRLADKNIIVCTPGRILQHLGENPNFNCDNMRMLVIDEADRVLDLGFERQMNAIISYLPAERQTLLFSATQTKLVKDLARLSLKDPVYVSVHEHAKYSTPEQLRQSYVVCDEHEKFNMLWSFVKNHQHSKVLVFVATCKQVMFAYEAIRRLRPHTTVLCLHGKMAEMKRVNVYQQFCNKQHVVMLATDLAARGLDFPAVDWVLQLDCPSEAKEYIHRCGRTARYRRDGESLLVLTPAQESAMVEQLKSERIPVTKITINPDKLINAQKKLEAFCTQDVKLKMLAQRALVGYVRSIFVMTNKNVFDVKQIDYEELAKSWGLAVMPRIRFLRKQAPSAGGTAYSKPVNPVNLVDFVDEATPTTSGPVFEVAGVAKRQEFSGWGGDDAEAADDLLTVKKRDVFNANRPIESDSEQDVEKKEVEAPTTSRSKSSKSKPLTRAAIAKKILKKKIVANKKVVFDEEGRVSNPNWNARNVDAEIGDDGDYRIDVAKKVMEAEDKIDLRNYRKRIKEKHKEEKRKRKLVEMEKRLGQKGSGAVVFADADDEEASMERSDNVQEVSDEDTEHSERQEESEYPERSRKKKKRRLEEPEDDGPRLQRDYSELDLEDAEQLALRLLDS